MKLLFTTCMVLSCLGITFAQGIQGNVTLSGSAVVTTTGHSVTLTWNVTQGAVSYNIYRGTTHGGPYIEVGSGMVNATYTDVHMTHNQTFYYVATAVSGNGESGYSNEAVAVIP
jgi:fibronectin type 3 domain-containing protein